MPKIFNIKDITSIIYCYTLLFLSTYNFKFTFHRQQIAFPVRENASYYPLTVKHVKNHDFNLRERKLLEK